MKIEDIDQKIGMPDVDQEWLRFRRDVMGGYWRRAAAIALVCGLGVVAVASVLYVRMFRTQPTDASALAATEAIGAATAAIDPDPTAGCFVFDDVELQQIAHELAGYYGVEPRFENPDVQHMRLYLTLDKEMSLVEVVEYLNNLQGLHLRLDHQLLIIE